MKKNASDKLKFSDYTKHGDIDQYIAGHIGKDWLDYRYKWRNATSLKEMFDYPLYVTTEQHFRCNYRCIMCYYSVNDQYEALNHNDRLGKDEMIRLIDELSEMGTPSLCLNAGNEPLMDKDIYKLVEYARKKGIIDVFMTTNGSLLSEEMADKLIDAGLTQIRISIDAYTPDTYKKVRVGQDLNRIKNNIYKLVDLKNKKASFLPIIRVSFVEMGINVSEFEDFKNYWKDVVDYVSLQRYTPVNLTEEKLSLIPPQRKKYNNTVCSMPFTMLYIRGNGDVYPCGRVEYGRKIGNIREDSIYKIYHGEELKEIRQLLLNLEYEKLPGCKDCFGSASLI